MELVGSGKLNGCRMEAINRWKLMELVGSGSEVDENFHALPCNFPLWKLGEPSGSKVEASTTMPGGSLVEFPLSFHTPP